MRDRRSPLVQHMTRVRIVVRGVMDRLTPVDTGRLRQANDARLIHGRRSLTVRCSNSARYAWYVHQGRGPIEPRRANVLAWKRHGRWHFAKRVGPMAGRPWVANAVRLTTGKTPR